VEYKTVDLIDTSGMMGRIEERRDGKMLIHGY
jgi:hypothetical protein